MRYLLRRWRRSLEARHHFDALRRAKRGDDAAVSRVRKSKRRLGWLFHCEVEVSCVEVSWLQPWLLALLNCVANNYSSESLTQRDVYKFPTNVRACH